MALPSMSTNLNYDTLGLPKIRSESFIRLAFWENAVDFLTPLSVAYRGAGPSFLIW